MKKFLSISLAVLAFILSSCTQKTVVSVEMFGAADSTMLVLSKLDINKLTPVDTIYTRKGKAKFLVEIKDGAPEFFYLGKDGSADIPLLLSFGEKVTLELNSIGELQNISGSAESALMQIVEADNRAFSIAFDSLSVALASAVEMSDVAAQKRISEEIGALYVARKKDAIKYIYAHTNSLTVIPLIFYKVTPELPLFSEYTDAILFEKVYDSLKKVYPSSAYLVSLMSEIEMRKNLLQMDTYLGLAEHQNFPEIILPDINAEQRALSELEGKVVLLYFWDPENNGMKLYNTDLLSIYEKYHSRGFEIYQVAITTNKTDWALYLKGQPLPWINVCDSKGDASYAARLYNVTHLPASFILAKDGTVTTRDLFDIKQLEKEIGRLVSAK